MIQSFEGGPSFRTWIDVLRYHSLNKPSHSAYTFLHDDEERESLTFSQLDQRARAVAAKLQSMTEPGARALLLYPAGLEYIVAFMGCIYAGVVPVPAYPLQSSQAKRHLPRLQSIFADAEPSILLTVSSQVANCEIAFPRTAGSDAMHWLVTDTIGDECADGWLEPILSPDSLAFLQYTSGSTAFPKGVMITHRNLLHNQSLIKKAFEHSESSIVAGWLPLYHDMGLIGNVLQPLFLGIRCILMSPMSFLQQPLRWLSMVSRYKATTSGGPNFAYELCCQKIRQEDRERLDLRSWKVAFNGAERVRPETIERFSRCFEISGFRRETFYPCYGLAEATLIVSGGKADSAPISRSFSSLALERDKAARLAAPEERSCNLIACGRSLQDQKILIVDPETRVECDPGKIGEIWISGESVGQGYWRKAEQTEKVFLARATDGKNESFLRTGDLGFMFDGELFISGRLKDLIIVGGYNHYPEDIELTVERAHAALRPGCGAAFSVERENGEGLVVVQEVDRRHQNANLEEAIFAIRQAVIEQHGIQPEAVVLVRAGSVPKTSSGKIQRHACRSRFLEQGFEVLKRDSENKSSELNNDSVSPETSFTTDASRLELYLLRQAARVLKVDPARLDPKRSLSSAGFDSLMAVQLATELEENLHVPVPMASLLAATSFADLASSIREQIARSRAAANDTIRNSSPPESVGNRFPITWQQESLWLQHQAKGVNSHTLNILVVVRFRGCLQVGALEKSLVAMIERHAILRTTYSFADERIVQTVRETIPLTLPAVSLLLMPEAAREMEVRRLAREQVRVPFDLENNAPNKALLLKTRDNEHVLLFLTHHIACDGWSIQLILQELSQLYQTFCEKGSRCPLLEGPCQYTALAKQVGAGQEAWARQLRYWRQQLGGNVPELFLPRDRPRNNGVSVSSSHESFIIPEILATRLKALSKNHDVTLFVTLLSAFKMLLCRYSQQADIVVGSSVANRNSAEVQSIVGPFTNAVALRTRFANDPDVSQILSRVKETTLGAFANQEVPFDTILREIGWKTGQPPLFNTIFLFQNFLVPVWNMSGIEVTLEEFETDLGNSELALVLYEKAGGLVGTLKFNADLYDRETARDLVSSYVAILEQMAKDANARLSQFDITEELAHKAARHQSQSEKIVIAATFVPDLVKPSLDFWMDELAIPCQVEFAPFNQIFQQLLDPQSLFRTNRKGLNVILVRFADWSRDVKETGKTSFSSLAEERADELVASLKVAASNSSVPFLVCLCPSELNSSEYHDFCANLERRLQADLKEISNSYCVGVGEIVALYPVVTVHDSYANEIGSVPYSPAFFTALGTIIARKLQALRTSPCKVIVLDCDQTLWKGVCAEDGVAGVQVDRARQALQEFMIVQRDLGTILCLASKNEERDVLGVFECHPDMRLKLEHITAKQINWNPKSENLKLLSQQLGLGLESFVFIDDNPIECAEVAAACPEVLVLQLPDTPEGILNFSNHVWAFDKLKATVEDQRRADFYQQDSRRVQLRSQAPTLNDFIASLNLECKICAIRPEQIRRVSQLAQRTNQFNTTTIRRSESEVMEFCSQAGHGCYVVDARDRFGDYGLIGAMFLEQMPDFLRVGSLMLSCRALGRGIEHQMLAFLGQQGQQHGATQIRIDVVHSSRNQPAVDFLKSVGAVWVQDDDGRPSFQISVDEAISVKYNPNHSEPVAKPSPSANGSVFHKLSSAQAMRIATQLCSVEQIDAAMSHRQPQNTGRLKTYVAPRTPIEEMLATMWCNVLRVERVGIHDNFMELGGHSLLGTVLVSRIRQTFGVELPLSVILEKPTVADLAAVIEEEAISRMSAEDLEAAMTELDGISDEEVKRLLKAEANSFEANGDESVERQKPTDAR